MFKHHLKVAIRNILKDKGYSLINIIGLAIAVSCCFLLLFWVRFELSYEHSFPYSNRIYRVLHVQDRVEGPHYSTHMHGDNNVISELKNNFPQIETAAIINTPFEHKMRIAGSEGEFVELERRNTGLDYLRMFAFEYEEGSPESVAAAYDGVVLSSEAARKLFGREPAMGRSIETDWGYVHTVSGVVKCPKNTHVGFDVLYPWLIDQGGPHYFMLREGTKLTPALRLEIENLLQTAKGSEDRLWIQPLYDVHLNTPKDVSYSTVTTNLHGDNYGNRAQLYLFSVAALIILLMAIINYVNTSVSRALSRMKEVGVRKVTGALRRQLIFRFLFESFITSLVGVILAMAITELILPGFTSLLGTRITVGFDWGTIGIAVGVCLLITVLSGGYSAFYLSAAKPVTVLRGGSTTGSKERIRKLLLGVQFFISISIFISTVVVYKQVNSIFNSDFGIDRNNIIGIRTGYWPWPDQYEPFIETIKRENSNIIEASMAYHAPYRVTRSYKNTNTAQEGDPEYGMEMNQTYVDYRFAEVFGLTIVEGDFLFPETNYNETIENSGYRICVINETLKDYLGYDDPIGRLVHLEGGPTKIVGVVKDFTFKPIKEKIMPLNLSFEPQAFAYCFIRTNGVDNKGTMAYIESKYKEMRPSIANDDLHIFTVEEDYREMYEDELKSVKLIAYFAVISFLISLMGIISMIAFIVEKRSKEIAIRKINGAKIWNISQLLSRGIVKTAIIASAAAIPLCYVLMSRWLEGYAYRTTLSWWIFIIVPVAVVILTLVVISVEIFIMARQNPIHSLRNE